jgi:hypothetical protein
MAVCFCKNIAGGYMRKADVRRFGTKRIQSRFSDFLNHVPQCNEEVHIDMYRIANASGVTPRTIYNDIELYKKLGLVKKRVICHRGRRHVYVTLLRNFSVIIESLGETIWSFLQKKIQKFIAGNINPFRVNNYPRYKSIGKTAKAAVANADATAPRLSDTGTEGKEEQQATANAVSRCARTPVIDEKAKKGKEECKELILLTERVLGIEVCWNAEFCSDLRALVKNKFGSSKEKYEEFLKGVTESRKALGIVREYGIRWLMSFRVVDKLLAGGFGYVGRKESKESKEEALRLAIERREEYWKRYEKENEDGDLSTSELQELRARCLAVHEGRVLDDETVDEFMKRLLGKRPIPPKEGETEVIDIQKELESLYEAFGRKKSVFGSGRFF